jgi:hypothetical protein
MPPRETGRKRQYSSGKAAIDVPEIQCASMPYRTPSSVAHPVHMTKVFSATPNKIDVKPTRV